MTALYFAWCVCACVCIVHPPLSTLSPYLEADWLLQMARLRRSLLYPILPPPSASKCGFTHVVRGSIVACPHAELPRLIVRSCLFQLKAQVTEERQPMRCFKLFQAFYLLSLNLTGVTQPRRAAPRCHQPRRRKWE